MKKLFAILPILLAQPILGSEIKGISTIDEVTVYGQGAQIERKASFQAISGTHTILLSGLSPFIKSNTLQVEGNSKVTILSVKQQKNYLSDLQNSKEKDELIRKIEAAKEDIALEQTNISVLNEEREFLKANRYIGGKDETLDPGKFKEFDAYFKYRMREIALNIHKGGKNLKEQNLELTKLQNQLSQLQGKNNLPMGELRVKVNINSAGKGEIVFRYQVANAGWYPSYDLRFDGKEKPLRLTYKAHVKQGTGIDWSNVKLKVSTAKTEVNAVIPELYPYYLDFYVPRPMTISRREKSMSDAAFGAAPEMALEEDNFEPVIVINKEIAVEFALNGRQSIASENKYEVFQVKSEQITANFEHQSVPKLSPHVYLVGKISDWYDLNLMDGAVNIFMENSFVGKSFVNTAQFRDTIDISFGVDRSVMVKRELNKDFSSETLIGGNKKVVRAYSISAHNQKSEKIRLRIFDQIPISKNKEIQILLGNIANGKVKKSTGKIEWNVFLESQTKTEINFDYTIKYPKDKQVLIGP
jgi:uncharacterized protein (TIGR02231 family)